MATATANGQVVSVERRRPRTPAASAWLLLAWVVLFFGGMTMWALDALHIFTVWSLLGQDPATQKLRVEPAGMVMIAVMVLGCGLLVVRARLLSALDRRVKSARGALCLNCHTRLGMGQAGECPKCGEAFTLAHVRDVWNKHTP